MSLSSILELCEQHMTEGEYLRASQTLKNIHDRVPEPSSDDDFIRRVYLFRDENKPALMAYEGEDGDEEQNKLTVVGYAKISKRERPNFYIRTQILYQFGNRPIIYVEQDCFKFVVARYAKFRKWLTVNCVNFGYNNPVQHFSDFLSFFNDKERAIMIETSSSGEDYLVDEDLEYLDIKINDHGLQEFYTHLGEIFEEQIIFLMNLKVAELQSS